nr:STAS/SEC14 domain-containing protein [Arthrobacter bambusae]
MIVVPDIADGGKASVDLSVDGHLNLRWQPGVHIDVEDAHAAMAKVNELCQRGQHPMLVDMASVASVSREARAVWSIPCGASRIALLGKSPVDRVLANFFLGVHVPPCPTRFFTSRAEAMDWLNAGA